MLESISLESEIDESKLFSRFLLQSWNIFNNSWKFPSPLFRFLYEIVVESVIFHKNIISYFSHFYIEQKKYWTQNQKVSIIFFLQGFLQLLLNLDGKFCYMQNKMFCIYKTFSFKIFFKPFIYPNSKNICNNIQNFMIRIPLNLDVALTVRIWLYKNYDLLDLLFEKFRKFWMILIFVALKIGLCK